MVELKKIEDAIKEIDTTVHWTLTRKFTEKDFISGE